MVLDLLRTFYYFNMELEERKSLLRLCLAQFNRLTDNSSGLVTVHFPKVLSRAESELVEMVNKACHDTYRVEMASALQMPLRVY